MAFTFGAADILTALGLTLTDWEVQSTSSNTQKDFAQVILNDGDVEEESDYNERTEYTAEFVCNTEEVDAFNVILGKEYGTGAPYFVITQCSLTQRAGDFATLSLTYHKHTGTKTHVAREYTVAMPQGGFGVLASLGISGTIPTAVMTLTTSASVDHVDKLDKDGAFLIGASTKCRLEESIEIAADGATPSLNAGWEQDSGGGGSSNTAYGTASLRIHTYQAAD